jgi:hypothetical protein
VQVKARSFLEADGEFQASVGSLHPDPIGHVLLPTSHLRTGSFTHDSGLSRSPNS